MRPFGNWSTDSSGTSMAPKRVLSMLTGICLLLTALPEEVQERLLNDVAAGLQSRLVDGLLHREVRVRLCHVRVLDVGEQLRERLLDLLEAAVGGLEPVRDRADVCARLADRVEVRVETLEVGRAQRVHVRDRAALEVLRDVAQDVQELAVGGCLALAEDGGAEYVHLHRNARADL